MGHKFNCDGQGIVNIFSKLAESLEKLINAVHQG